MIPAHHLPSSVYISDSTISVSPDDHWHPSLHLCVRSQKPPAVWNHGTKWLFQVPSRLAEQISGELWWGGQSLHQNHFDKAGVGASLCTESGVLPDDCWLLVRYHQLPQSLRPWPQLRHLPQQVKYIIITSKPQVIIVSCYLLSQSTTQNISAHFCIYFGLNWKFWVMEKDGSWNSMNGTRRR